VRGPNKTSRLPACHKIQMAGCDKLPPLYRRTSSVSTAVHLIDEAKQGSNSSCRNFMKLTNSLDRALLILELVSSRTGGWSNAELSRRLGIATSSCSYVLGHLERAGYLTRRSAGRYEIGIKMVRIAYGALGAFGLRDAAKPVLHKLAAETGLSAFVAVLDNGAVMLIEHIETPEFAKIDVQTNVDLEIGIQFPPHATALGKALLSHLSNTEVLAIVRKDGLEKWGPKTNLSETQLLEDLKLVRTRGYAIVDEEYRKGVRAVGAPIVGLPGGVPSALIVAGTTAQPAWREKDLVISLVKKAANQVSERARYGLAGNMKAAPTQDLRREQS
jgi:IclR family KDG regulon transcriptional repressor